jgi:hypothetical protein
MRVLRQHPLPLILVLLVFLSVACGDSAIQPVTEASTRESATATSEPETTTTVVIPPAKIPEQFGAVTDLVGADEIVDVIASPDFPEVAVIRLEVGTLTAPLETELLDVLATASPPDAAVYVFECPFTRAAWIQFKTYVDSETWRDDDSGAVLEQAAQLDTSIYGGGIRGCRIEAPLRCASLGERDAIEARAGDLGVSWVDFWTGGRDAIGWDVDKEPNPTYFWDSADNCL